MHPPPQLITTILLVCRGILKKEEFSEKKAIRMYDLYGIVLSQKISAPWFMKFTLLEQPLALIVTICLIFMQEGIVQYTILC